MDITRRGEAGAARDLRPQGAPRQAARAPVAPHRGAQGLARDRRAHARARSSDSNRKHLLREQMRTIQKELGEGDEAAAEIAELEKAIDRSEDARGGREAGAQGAEAPRADARRRRRVFDDPHVPRLADRAAVGGRARGRDRHRRGAAHPRRRPLRPREDQEAHPRVPRGAQAQSRRARARSCASSGRPAWARPRSARASPGRPGASSCA